MPARPTRLRVLTLNLWNKTGPWDLRLPLVRAGLLALEPDLVALQEVLSLDGEAQTQAHEVARGLGYHVAVGPAWNMGNGLRFNNAVLSRHPILEAHNAPLPVERADDAGRAALGTIVETPAGRVPFFSTHLSWKFHEGAIRCRQVVALVAHVERLAPLGGHGFPPIVAGDFNAVPESDEMRFLGGLHAIDGRSVYFADCHAVAGDGTPGHTYARRNAHAAPAREPDRRLDYVLVRGPDRMGRGEPLAARVVLDEATNGVFASDHFGVCAEIAC